jgi:NADP-dependent 3-hydroxy acid dehydrogenase YdfG
MILKGKTAVITGASSGIGAALSKILVQKGAIVYGIARRLEKLQAIEKILGSDFIPVPLDITDMNSVSEWVDATFGESNLPDILVNNAGLGFFGNIEDISPEDWHMMMNVNLNGVFYITRKLVPLFKQNEAHTHIINIASVAGLIGNPQISGYNATKFGLRGFSDALFKELRFDKIKVTCVFPGSVATEFFEKSGSSTHDHMMRAEDVAGSIVHVLETPDNFLIDEITMRPLNPKPPQK